MNGDRASGFYEIPEAARFLRAYFSAQFAEEDVLANVTSIKLGRWVRAGLAGPGNTERVDRKLWITFYQLVSLQIVAALRGKRLSMQKIRRAQEWMRDYTGHPVPFATEDVWTDRNNIFAEMRGDMAAVDRGGQLAFAYVRERLIKVPRLTFDEAGVVATWEPIDGVLVDPNIQFGAPCIKGTRIQTWVLSNLARYGESEESIKEDYGVTRADIEAAMEWEALTTGQSIDFPVPA